MKNKTLATWIAFLGGPLGLHRFYLRGWQDPWGWACPIPTALGLYGWQRALELGIDDRLSWLLIPVLGLSIAASSLQAILFGLMPTERWNARYNPQLPPDAPAGAAGWLTIFAVIGALLVGAGAMLFSISLGIQRFFEY